MVSKMSKLSNSGIDKNRCRQYRKNKQYAVSAVQLNLDTDGFIYRKWGSEQRCRAGDWIVQSDSDCYTINQESFTSTYEKLSPGRYLKTAPIWAERLEEAGSIKTREGFTEYEAGDYLVHNNEDGNDSYAISKDKFEQMYRPVDDESD